MRQLINSISILLILVVCIESHAQSKQTRRQKSQTTVSKQYFTPPQFPGGDSTLQDYLHRNIHYPNMAREIGIEGTVQLEFFINEQGQPEDIRIIRDISAGCSQEAIRVIKNMPPWIPGTYRGRKIRMLYTLPVKFQLRD